MTVPGPDTTLKDAQDWLRPLLDAGAKCPCCRRMAKVYRRKLNSGMSRSMIRFWRKHGREWGFAPDLFGYGNEFVRLHFWGLIEEMPERRDDGGRAGWWRITHQGERFVKNEVTVQSHARIYDARCLGLVGDPVTISATLGKKFNYSELMAGT